MNQIEDLFRNRLDQTIDLIKPPTILATRIPWQELEAAAAHGFARRVRAGEQITDIDLFDSTVSVVGAASETVYMDLGYRAIDAEIPRCSLRHQGKYICFTELERRLLKRRSSVEPVIWHLKSDHGKNRCHP